MSRIFVAGIGAVSPAGWSVAGLRCALSHGEPLPIQSLARPGMNQPLCARLVPNPPVRPEFLAHPRLRRSSPVTHYAASAALEAVAGWRAHASANETRLGVVACLQSGCVQYSCRFYDETLKDPATASPLVFPETVYAAPTSHVAALLQNVVLAGSLVGDPSAFLQGVALGAEWLSENRVDACVVIGAEEIHWIIADALRLLDRTAVVSGGAGALCLCRDPMFSTGVELTAITDAHTFTASVPKALAARAMRQQLGEFPPAGLLVDGLGNSARTDAAERAAWSDWEGARLSPKHVFGEGMTAAAAWQCVAACDALADGRFAAANVSLVGANQQAIGARLVRA
jgi:3-oxoacyl-(acyl-carrier-protein) synthase